jgi:hemoglobin
MSRSLFERLGGEDAITAVIEEFVARCAADDRINGKFIRSDVPRLKANLVDMVCEATGGPCTYSGRDMRTTHDGMAVTAAEFDALVEDLVATLDKFGVGEAEKTELLNALAPMRPDIVEIETAETGTPLPESYRNAPGLAHA